MKRLALVVCLVASYAFGQGGAVTAVPTITNTRGEPVPYAQVAVCSQNPGSLPTTVCNGSFATLYTDITISVACQTDVTPIAPISGTGCTNPGKSDGLGNVVAFAPAGQYWCEYSGGSITRPIVVPCFFSSGGGAANLNCPAALNGSLGAFTSTTTFSCDPNMGTDFAGNGFSQSWKYLGPVNGFFGVIGGTSDPGTQAKFKLNTNEVRMLAPLTVPTPYYWRIPGTRCAVGQGWQMTGEATDANGDKVDTYGCATFGSTVTLQTNSVNNSSQTLLNLVQGSNVTITNTSGGNVQISASGAAAPQASNPSAPVLTTNGAAGTTSYTYLVVGCEDGSTCAYHSAASSTTTIATGNATLSSSNSINLQTYADTLYGYRCYNIYRTASAGTPSSTGKIATCAGKTFVDTGLAGDSTTAPNTNTTALDSNGLIRPLQSCNSVPKTPDGIDAWPCSPSAEDAEMTQTFGAPADVNDGLWKTPIALNAGTTLSWTNGTMNITDKGTGGILLQCVMKPIVGAAPYAYVEQQYATTGFSHGGWSGLGLYESATGKFETEMCALDPSANQMQMIFQKWTNSTTKTNTFVGGIGSCQAVQAFAVKNDSTNLNYYASTDGVMWSPLLIETIGTFFTTAPDYVGMCTNNSNASGTTQWTVTDVDYFRKVSTSSLP